MKHSAKIQWPFGRILLIGILVLCLLTGTFGMMGKAYALNSYAAVSLSENELEVGDTLTAEITFDVDESMFGLFANIVYDPLVLQFTGGDAEGGDGSLSIKEMLPADGGKTTFTYVLNFTALMAGTSPVSIISSSIYDVNAVSQTNPTAVNTVTVASSGTLSSDNSLAGISLSYGDLEPAFSPEITYYTLSVPNEINSLTINPWANDAGASVWVDGEAELLEGSNERTITVTAPNGDVNTYYITIYREESAEESSEEESSEEESSAEESSEEESSEEEVPVLPIKVNGISHYLQSLPEELRLPSGFKTAVWTYHDTEFEVAENEAGTQKLLYLTDSDDENGKLYWYNEEKDICEEFTSVTINKTPYLILDAKQEKKAPTGYEKTDITLQGSILTAFARNGASINEYIVLAVGEDGKKDFYIYNTRKSTMNRYSGGFGEDSSKNSSREESSEEESSAPESQTEESSAKLSSGANRNAENLQKLVPYLLIGLFLLLLIIIVLIILIIRSSQRRTSEAESSFEENIENLQNTAILPVSEPAEEQAEETAVPDDEQNPEQEARMFDWKEATQQIPVSPMSAVQTTTIQAVAEADAAQKTALELGAIRQTTFFSGEKKSQEMTEGKYEANFRDFMMNEETSDKNGKEARDIRLDGSSANQKSGEKKPAKKDPEELSPDEFFM